MSSTIRPTCVYKPFGEAVQTTMPEFGFTGQRFEAVTGLYDYRARWYDPGLGRFLSADPLVPRPYDPQSLNRYTYVDNDPIGRIDPTGFTGCDFDFCSGDNVIILESNQDANFRFSISAGRVREVVATSRLGTQDLAEDLAEGGAVFLGEPSELAQHEAPLDGGDDGLEDRGAKQPGLLPLRDGRLTEGRLRPRLAGDGEDDEIRPLAVVGVAADDDGGAALGGGLIGEGGTGRGPSPRTHSRS